MSEQLHLADEEISITLRRAWDRALRTLVTRVNKPTYETHIRAIRPVSLAEAGKNGKNVYIIKLGVPSVFAREWVEKRHASLIAGALEEALDQDVQVEFVLIPKDAPAPSLFSQPPASSSPRAAAINPASPRPLPSEVKKPSPPPMSEQEPPAPTTPFAAQKSPAAPRRDRCAAHITSEPDIPALNPRYTFDSFIVGQSNRLAHAGAWAVAQSPGRVYNPLFLYGPSGLGKTHLMHAIGNDIAQKQALDTRRIAYISGEAFTSNYITSLREHRTEEFRRKWRSVDLWLVDDIQFIAGKEHTKEEFFHTFNALYQTGKQIVISSDRSPRELRMMDERLRSRFECGLIADIAPPDLETRLAILHRKAEVEHMHIPDDVLLYMARLVQSNIRTLEGALVKLIAYASLQNSEVTTELASSVLEHYYIAAGIGDMPEADASVRTDPRDARTDVSDGVAGPTGAHGTIPQRFLRRAVTPELVQRVVARRFGLDPDALVGKKRDKEVVLARQIAMHLMRELTETSLPGIGQLFGGRDHSTVMHACERVRALMPFDDDLRSMVEDLTVQIRSQTIG